MRGEFLAPAATDLLASKVHPASLPFYRITTASAGSAKPVLFGGNVLLIRFSVHNQALTELNRLRSLDRFRFWSYVH